MTDTYKQFAQRTDNIAAFRNTVMNIKNDSGLKEIADRSSAEQKVIRAYDLLRDLPDGTRNAEVKLTPRKTLEAARQYAAMGKRVAILNCAADKKPGGETENGHDTQEASLCKCTTLYPCLNSTDALMKFYNPHKNNLNAPHTMNSCLTTDDCIYTPDVEVFKEDAEGYRMLPESERFTVDVISCSAPEFISAFTSPFLASFGSNQPFERSRIENVYRKRFERILSVARKAGVDVVILDFWGYRRSEEDACIVSEAAYKAAESFVSCFDTIEAAVGYSSAGSNTYNIYARAFDKNEPYPEVSSSVM